MMDAQWKYQQQWIWHLKKLVFLSICVVIALSSFPPAEASPLKRTPDEVLLVYNSNSPISKAIADYYAAQRGVTNVLAVSCQDSALNGAESWQLTASTLPR